MFPAESNPRRSLGKTKVFGQMLKSWATLEPVLVYRSMQRFKQSFRVKCLLSWKWFTFCHTWAATSERHATPLWQLGWKGWLVQIWQQNPKLVPTKKQRKRATNVSSSQQHIAGNSPIWACSMSSTSSMHWRGPGHVATLPSPLCDGRHVSRCRRPPCDSAPPCSSEASTHHVESGCPGQGLHFIYNTIQYNII